MEKPPISLFELVAIASNTGCTSDGELAITFRMSAVAVCLSSASLFGSLVEQPGILDRDQCLIAEGFGKRDFALTEDIRLFSTQREQADAFALAHQRQIKCRVYADRLMDVALVFGQVDERPVRQVKRSLLDDGTRGKVGAGIDRLFYQRKFIK